MLHISECVSPLGMENGDIPDSAVTASSFHKNRGSQWVKIMQTLGYFMGGGLLQPKSYVDVPAGPRKSWFSPYQLFAYLYHLKTHPIVTKLGAFYNNVPQIDPIYVIWALSSLMKTHDRYTKFREKAPQKAGTYTYTMSVWEPLPPPPGFHLKFRIVSSINSRYRVFFSNFCGLHLIPTKWYRHQRINVICKKKNK